VAVFKLISSVSVVSEFIADFVLKNPNAVITFATGNTMIPVYQSLAKTGVDFSGVSGFHLDEYFPCSPEADYSFVGYLRKLVKSPLKIKNFYEIDGNPKDPLIEINRYENLLKSHPVDLAILGIGPWDEDTNTGGHIGFNEAGTDFSSRVHLAKLSPVTVSRDHARGQSSPSEAFTQGIGNILESKNIILIATGTSKTKSVSEALFGPVSSNCPASALQNHPSTTFFLDFEPQRP
jgi:glucosamine-6-phosphate deaminase